MVEIYIHYQRYCGHSSVKVTEDEYLDLTDEDLAEMYQRHSPIMNLRRSNFYYKIEKKESFIKK